MSGWQGDPRIGDRVMYVVECDADRCAHHPMHDRAADIVHIDDDGLVWLHVLHPTAIAMLRRIPRGGLGQPGTWYPRADP